MAKVELTGQKQENGRLTAICITGRDKHGNALWLCRCKCFGLLYNVSTARFVKGSRKGGASHCGCAIKTPNTFEHRLDGTTVIRITCKNGQRYECFIDTNDFELINHHQWRIIPGHRTLYVGTNINGSNVGMHRFIVPGCDQVDHIDHNGLNNRRCNLRPANHSLNSANARRPRTATSKYRGVSWCPRERKFRVSIKVHQQYKSLGYFDSEEAAAIMYNIFAKLYFGEFASLNELSLAA